MAKACSTIRKLFGLFRLFWVKMCTGQGTQPLRQPHSLKQEAKETAWKHLPFNTAGVLFCFSPSQFSWMCLWVSVIGNPEVRGLTEAGGAHVSLAEPTWYAVSSQGAEREDEVSVSANLAGRWLTSPRPSKCDLGHTFNEIHSTWQAPPLPRLSAWSPPLFQSDCCLHVLLLYVQCVSPCARAQVNVWRSVYWKCFRKGSYVETSNENWINLSNSAPACQLPVFQSTFQVHCCFQ